MNRNGTPLAPKVGNPRGCVIPHCASFYSVDTLVSRCMSMTVILCCIQDVQRVCLVFRRALQNPAKGTYGRVAPRLKYFEIDVQTELIITLGDLKVLSDWLIAREAGLQTQNSPQ